jgi:hypothetical protein
VSDHPKDITSRSRLIVRPCKIFGTEPANDERRITERNVGGFALLVLKNLGVLKNKNDRALMK